ncbi:MAG TPA: hypothetical protein PLV65_12215 [Tenuifilaceae bacterium]|nr:hypothetical protein [Tenuifilaceae bacterium]
MKKLYALLIFSILAFATFAQVPQIEVNPVIFSEELEIGQTMTVTATITNTGNRDLNWSISNVKTHFEKPNYADWNLPENQEGSNRHNWVFITL